MKLKLLALTALMATSGVVGAQDLIRKQDSVNVDYQLFANDGQDTTTLNVEATRRWDSGCGLAIARLKGKKEARNMFSKAPFKGSVSFYFGHRGTISGCFHTYTPAYQSQAGKALLVALDALKRERVTRATLQTDSGADARVLKDAGFKPAGFAQYSKTL